MKRFFPLILFGLLLCSACYRTIYQVTELASPHAEPKGDDFVFTGPLFDIHYYFWAKGGLMSYRLINKTDSALVLDLSKCKMMFNADTLHYVFDPADRYVLIPGRDSFYISTFGLNQEFIKGKKYPKKNSEDAIPISAHYDFFMANYLAVITALQPKDTLTGQNEFSVGRSYYLSRKGMDNLSPQVMNRSFFQTKYRIDPAGSVATLAFYALLGWFFFKA